MTDLVLIKSSLFYLSLMSVPILKSSTKEVRGSSPEYLVSVNIFWEARPPFFVVEKFVMHSCDGSFFRVYLLVH